MEKHKTNNNMISNEVVRNCKTAVPIIKTMLDDNIIGKIKIKNLYTNWQGETIQQIKDKNESNPYHLRIGLPHTDEKLKNDRVFFVTNYLSFNPITKDIEDRQLIPFRAMSKVFIGQSTTEQHYPNSKLIVDGTIAVQDIYLTNKQDDQSLSSRLAKMELMIQNLQEQIVSLKQQLKGTIYKQEQV